MADKIKGITIEFRGNATPLQKAIREVDKSLSSTTKELSKVNTALKFNPTSVDLWRQKQALLEQKVKDTKTKLDSLKQAQAQMDAAGVEKNSKQYRNLQRQIIETEGTLKTFEGQLKAIGNVNLRATSEKFKEIGSSLDAAGQKMKGVSAAAAGLVVALGGAAYKAGTLADDLNTMSKVTGVSTQTLQKYSYAADLVDVSTETLAKSQTRLKKSMLSAKDGGKTAEAFEALGIAVTDSNGSLRDSEDVFQELLKSLGSMENETERDALAMQLLGKSATELNPLIADGGETYKMVANTLSKYDLDYIDQETLDKANEFNDSIDTMKLLGSVAFAQVGSALASTLAPALEKVVEYVGKFAGWLGNLDPKILTVIGSVAALVATIAPLLIVVGKIAFAISSITGLMATLGTSIGAILSPIGIAIAVIGAIIAAFILWRKHGDKIKKFFADFGKKMGAIWVDIKDAIAESIEGAKQAVSNTMSAIKTSITNIFTAIKSFASTAWNNIKTAITGAVNGIKTVITTVFNAIKTFIITVVTGYLNFIRAEFNLIRTAVTLAVNGIKTVITTVFNAIKKFLQTVVNGWKIILTTAWSGIKTAAQTAWNGIKTAITDPIQKAKDTLSRLVGNIKNSLSFGGIAGSVRSAFNSVKEAISSPIQKAWNLVKSAVGKIKSIFPISLGKIFSGIKLPHFRISGGRIPWGIGGQGVKPSIDIDWYKNGAIFTKPTLFMNGDRLSGLGEAGAEGVIPITPLWNKLDRIAENTAGGGDITINVYATPGMDIKELAAEIEQRLIESQKRRRLAWQ